MTCEIDAAVVARLRSANRVAVLTGAVVAAESGVPSARECLTGEWAPFAPTELATAQAFAQHPRLVWAWYAYRRQMIENASPSASHYALVDLEQYYSAFTLITQNIDGLHWRAGSRELLELHGNIGRVRCFDCGHYAQSWDDETECPPCVCGVGVCCARMSCGWARDYQPTSCAWPTTRRNKPRSFSP